MIFDDNTAYQTYRIFVAVFGTLGMVLVTSPLRKNYKRNLLLCSPFFSCIFGDFCLFSESLSLLFLCRV